MDQTTTLKTTAKTNINKQLSK